MTNKDFFLTFGLQNEKKIYHTKTAINQEIYSITP